MSVKEICPRCRGFVWHRREPCNCRIEAKAVIGMNHKEFREAVGNRIKACRESREWSLAKLALKSGMGKVGLWQIERGQSEPSSYTIMILAEALEVSADYLLMRSAANGVE